MIYKTDKKSNNRKTDQDIKSTNKTISNNENIRYKKNEIDFIEYKTQSKNKAVYNEDSMIKNKIYNDTNKDRVSDIENSCSNIKDQDLNNQNYTKYDINDRLDYFLKNYFDYSSNNQIAKQQEISIKRYREEENKDLSDDICIKSYSKATKIKNRRKQRKYGSFKNIDQTPKVKFIDTKSISTNNTSKIKPINNICIKYNMEKKYKNTINLYNILNTKYKEKTVTRINKINVDLGKSDNIFLKSRFVKENLKEKESIENRINKDNIESIENCINKDNIESIENCINKDNIESIENIIKKESIENIENRINKESIENIENLKEKEFIENNIENGNFQSIDDLHSSENSYSILDIINDYNDLEDNEIKN